MRSIDQYSFNEFSRFLPLRDFLTEKRNSLYYQLYISFPHSHKFSKRYDEFIDQTNYLINQNIICVIAFENPLVIDWLLRLATKNCNEFTILIIDNSRKNKLRSEIKKVCIKHQTHYFSLPYNPTRHPNRSHALAMGWVYYNIIVKIAPKYFGFIDHDMLTIAKVNFPSINSQKCYGLINQVDNSWFLWAGYSFFNYQLTKEYFFNFLYDFSRKLDTAGRLYDSIYKNIKLADFKGAKIYFAKIIIDQKNQLDNITIIDDKWLHIGNISYNDNFSPKENFYKKLIPMLESGIDLNELIVAKNKKLNLKEA